MVKRPVMAVTLVGLTTVMLVPDTPTVLVALGEIQVRLRTRLTDVQWTLDAYAYAYALALACLLLTAARLGDRLGRARLLHRRQRGVDRLFRRVRPGPGFSAATPMDWSQDPFRSPLTRPVHRLELT
jgi:hypothetical protein